MSRSKDFVHRFSTSFSSTAGRKNKKKKKFVHRFSTSFSSTAGGGRKNKNKKNNLCIGSQLPSAPLKEISRYFSTSKEVKASTLVLAKPKMSRSKGFCAKPQLYSYIRRK
jgi:hypothetical protein